MERGGGFVLANHNKLLPDPTLTLLLDEVVRQSGRVDAAFTPYELLRFILSIDILRTQLITPEYGVRGPQK